MFAIDQKVNNIQLKDKNILKVYVSMNNHLVATPDTSLEEARSYVFLFREGKRKLSVYIGLHLLLTDRKLFYAHSDNPLSEEDLQEVEDEARNFAEDLGAMLDEVNFADMSDLEKDRWIEEQGIFSEKKKQAAEPVEQAPRPEVAPAAPEVKAPQSNEMEKAAPASEEVSAPETPKAPRGSKAPEAPELTVPETLFAEVEEQEEPEKVAEPASVQKSDQAKSTQIAAAKRRQEITRKTAATGIEKPQKQAREKELPSATGVVRRDREALARLLTSF